MKSPARWIFSIIKLQISSLMAWLIVAPPILASDGQPGDYLNSTSNQSQPAQSYQGYTQTQASNDGGAYSASGNYSQQPQQPWSPQPAGQPSYYGQVQTQQSAPQQNYNSGYQQPTTNVNMSSNVWRGAQPTASESNTQNSGQASSAQSDPNSGQTARAMGQVATKVLPVAAAMVGMGIMNKMRTGSMMGYPSYGYGGYGGGYGGYGNPYAYGNYGGYGGYGGGYGGYGMNPMNMMSRMGMGGMGMGGMGMNPLNMIHF